MLSGAWIRRSVTAGAAFIFTCVGCGRDRATGRALPDGGGGTADIATAPSGSTSAPAGSMGVLTIRIPAPPKDLQVDVRLTGTQQTWQPTAFPARLAVPIDRKFSVWARAPGHLPYYRDGFTLSALHRAEEVVVELVEFRPYFGFGEADIPTETGLEIVMPARDGIPAASVFVSAGGRPALGGSRLVIDERGDVWYGARHLRVWSYDLVARVQSCMFDEMLALREEAVHGDTIPLTPGYPGSGTIEVYGTSSGGEEGIEIARSSRRRASPAAAAIIVWMVAVQREVLDAHVVPPPRRPSHAPKPPAPRH